MTISLIPDSAPFTTEQRAWLNGFLAGWVGLEANGAAPASLGAAVEALPTPTPNTAEPEEVFPWHDPNLTIVQRLELADGKPLANRLMAAMAQLDCGACGYVCKTYSEAIANGSETSLTLCSPGGKNTAKAIKQLLKDGSAANGNGTVARNGAAKAAINGHAPNGSVYHRANPFLAKLKSTQNLNKPGSAKHTVHVVLDLSGSGISYRVGDALGVYPSNSSELVDSIIAAVRLDPDSTVAVSNGQELTLRDALRRHFCLRAAPEEMLALLARKAAVDAEREAIESALADESSEHFDVLDAIQLVPSAQLSELELLESLPSLAPRLYSIASSMQAHHNEVHLTVGRVAYEQNGRERLGVASTMFADRVRPGDAIGVFIHSASDFTVPPDPNAPMIMIGPGTGIAPFRAFLEERQATKATGKNWLFFGDQAAATDFLYGDELEAMQSSGLLTHLDTAFSRDQEYKIYVQDRMREKGAKLFGWLEEGAYFFVCGDARRMAVDVDRALHEIVAKHGGMTIEDATAYVLALKQQKRYIRDVY